MTTLALLPLPGNDFPDKKINQLIPGKKMLEVLINHYIILVLLMLALNITLFAAYTSSYNHCLSIIRCLFCSPQINLVAQFVISRDSLLLKRPAALNTEEETCMVKFNLNKRSSFSTILP